MSLRQSKIPWWRGGCLPHSSQMSKERARKRLNRPHLLISRTSSNNAKSSVQEALGVLILRKWVPRGKALLFPEALLMVKNMEEMGLSWSWCQFMRWPLGSSYWEWEDLCFQKLRKLTPQTWQERLWWSCRWDQLYRDPHLNMHLTILKADPLPTSLFPGAAVLQNHKVHGLNQHMFVPHSLGGAENLNEGVSGVMFLFKTLGKDTVFIIFLLLG